MQPYCDSTEILTTIDTKRDKQQIDSILQEEKDKFEFWSLSCGYSFEKNPNPPPKIDLQLKLRHEC